MSRTGRLLLGCLVGGLAWAICEVLGGLLFLAFGVRLWSYYILPIFWEITSPVIWAIAALLIVPLMVAFDRAAGTSRLPPARRAALRLAFMMTVGPVLEVLINRYVFVGWLGRPLYLYTVLPTFEGSGSLLSPLYYATLYIHVPVTDRILSPARPYSSDAATPASPETRTDRAASMSGAA